MKRRNVSERTLSAICDELNIKEVIYLDDFDSLSSEYASLNFQVAGRQLKGDLNKVKAICDNLSLSEQENLVTALKKGQPVRLAAYDNSISADCFTLFKKDKENVARSADGSPVAINTEITPALKAEGVYRELFGFALKGSVLAFIGAYLLVMVSIHSIGMIVASLAPNAQMAGVIASVIYFPMIFLSGATIPY